MSQPDLEAGVRIGDFCIEARVGIGGMGIVYCARQVSLDRVVALKVLGGALAHPTEVARFRRAAQAAARLRHPNIAAVHFIGQDDRLCYLAMEYIDGESLQQVIHTLATTAVPLPSLDAALSTKTGPNAAAAIRFDVPDDATSDLPGAVPRGPALTPAAAALIADPQYHRRCCEVIRDAARALHHAHEQGVVHRDIKPGNLMLDRLGQVRVIDFGIARFFEDNTLTQTGQLVGTPMYMSPEQVTGRLELTAKTDIYSLGLVLYELLTLRPPIAAANREELLGRIVTKPLAPIARANPALPESLRAVVHKATAKDPDERYATAEGFADDLQRWLDGAPVEAEPPVYQWDRSEIAAARPDYLVGVAIIYYLMGAVGSITGAAIVNSFVIQVMEEGWPADFLHQLLLPMSGCFSGFVGLVCAWVASGILRGSRWSRVTGILVQTALMLLYFNDLLKSLLVRETTLHYKATEIWFTVIFAAFSGYNIVQLQRRRTRDWFALARRLRAEAVGAT